MSNRDDFEHRFGQGLKRWAQAGEPGLDLEALVRERLGEPGEAGQAAVCIPRRRWAAWLVGAATVGAVALGLGTTFPAWAGAAANWPLIGPAITQILLEDAGLKWAYEMGLIQGNLAEVNRGGVTVRILGVVADARRTTVLYQVQGAPAPERQDEQPIPADSMIVPPSERPALPVSASVSKVNGQGGMSFSSPPVETPVGYVGTVSTLPLETEQAELELIFGVGGEQFVLTVPASRAETDRFSREVTVDQSQEIDGIRVTVDAVIYTPAETVIRYREESEPFYGGLSWDPEVEYDYLEINGQQYRASGGGSGVNRTFLQAYPPVEGARLVLGTRVKGEAIDAVWPLAEGVVAEVMGIPVTLAEIELQADGIGFVWTGPERHPFRGFAGFEVIDKEGKAHPIGGSWYSQANYVNEGMRIQRFATELPKGVEPVAIRATRAAVAVKGPWVFELPR